MSIRLDQELCFWTDVLTSLRRTPAYRENTRLTDRDNETVCQVIVLNVLVLKDIAQEAGCRRNSNLKRWCITTHQLPIQTFDNMQKDILAFLRNYEGGNTYDDFKHHLSAYGPSLLGAFVAPVRDYLEEFLKVPSSSPFSVLNQFFSFMGRTSLIDVNFQDKMLADYYANEERLQSLNVPPEIISSLNLILRRWLQSFKVNDLHPKHGPGSTAELPRTTPHKKFAEFRFDQKLDYLTKEIDPLLTLPFTPPKGLERCAKVVFVKKNLSTMRTICKEPAVLMYYQQAAWDLIEKYVDRHPFLRQRIRFSDQTYNRELARYGSLTGEYATIDLSAASDSVSWDLVKGIFKGTSYYKLCLLTRSVSVKLPDGQVIAIKKFAPMGSALCFPTECLVFLAICEYAAQLEGVRKPMSYSVYGDDIIIRRELVPRLLEILSATGFLVNSSKSFFSGRFRESCGGEYYEGVDVTPIRIPRKFEGRKLSVHTPGLFRLTIDLCNQLKERKMRLARSLLIKNFSSLPVTLQPIFDDGTRGIASEQPTNFHLRKLYLRDYQAWYSVHGVDLSRSSPYRTDDEISLFIWHQSAATRSYRLGLFPDPSDTIVVQSERPIYKLKTSRSSFLSEEPTIDPRKDRVNLSDSRESALDESLLLEIE
ncbi:RNA-directed RNA polymerase [ssRNA phage SRR6960799_2]|uniref:RNA-directed RNA polymerase n=1 Tax=ssRNA phage SRR6960799_2 TaxID=2786576 RepID=A0A8S5L3B5_9VIRU|nr:RNA-directed RNA polymerase [ssRNA phage SRR6960799_2]DAD52270.1 TPA_asm: RNA-directed RNA polymerase [ssRNA phage SRR6960799_2]